jgi:uncharacterized phage-associated protein
VFDPEIATAVAYYFVSRAQDKSLNDLKLMKLMVISERTILRETNSPLTGAKFSSMKHGPVLSEVWSLLSGEKTNETWSNCLEFIRHKTGDPESNRVKLKSQIEIADILPQYDVEVLNRVWMQYKNHGKWSLVDLTHTFPEWDKTRRDKGGSTPIPWRKLFKSGFKLSEAETVQRIEQLDYFERITA